MADAPNPSIGTEPEPKDTQEPKSDIDLTIEKLGISSSEQLENMQTASQQTGRLAQIVGDLRSELGTERQERQRLQQMV